MVFRAGQRILSKYFLVQRIPRRFSLYVLVRAVGYGLVGLRERRPPNCSSDGSSPTDDGVCLQ